MSKCCGIQLSRDLVWMSKCCGMLLWNLFVWF